MISQSKHGRFKDHSCNIAQVKRRQHFERKPAEGAAPLVIDSALRSMGVHLKDDQVQALKRVAGAKSMDSIVALGTFLTSQAPDGRPEGRAQVPQTVSRFQTVDSSKVVEAQIHPKDSDKVVLRRDSVTSNRNAETAAMLESTNRLLESNRGLRNAFLKMPHDIDGTVRKDVLAQELQKAIPSAQASRIADALPTSQVDYSAFVRAVQPPDESVDGAGVLSFRDTARGLAGQPIPGAVVDTPKLARRHSTSAVASVPHIWTDTEKNSLKLRKAVQDRLLTLFGSQAARARKLFLKFQRDSDGLATVDSVAKGLKAVGVNANVGDVQNLISLATGTSASTATRVDYNTFHKAVEALLIPASDQTRQAVFVPGPISVTPAAAGAADSRRVDTVMQRADMDQGLEFEGDDPTLRAAKRDVCRKVRTQLQSHLTMPRKAFLTVDKNRDGLLSRQELRSGLTKVGVELNEQEMDYLMDAVDKERTGVINYTKFANTFFPPDTNTEFGAQNPSSLLFTAEHLRARGSLDGYTPVALVDDLGMLAVHAGNVDNQPSLTSSQRAQQHFHGPAPYLKDEVQRDTYGAPAEFLKDGGSDKADEQQIYNKRETAVFRRVMSRIAEKSASARKMFLSIDVNHEGELSYQALRDGLAKLGAPTTKEEFDLLTRKVDTDSLGKVTYAQFARAFKMDDAIPKPGDAPPSVYPEQNRTDFYEVSPSSPRKFKHPHRFDPGEDGPTEPNLGKPRHMQDSRVVAASLRSEDAVPATNAADARMHMQVLDKMLAKRKSLRDVFVRLERDTSGHVGVKNIREQLAKQGILVSERQMEAFLTPSLSPSLDGSIDFSTFVNLARPRAPMPTPTPSYVRKADFSANATGGTVGYSAKEGYGPFGLVDETYSEAQRDPLVTSQHVAFTRASNTLPSGQSLTEASATGTNPLRAAADEEHAGQEIAGAQLTADFTKKKKVVPNVPSFFGESVKTTMFDWDEPTVDPPMTKQRKHFVDTKTRLTTATSIVSEKVGSASQSVSEEREAPKAAPTPAPPAGQRTFNKILKPQITPMDVVGIAREAAAAAQGKSVDDSVVTRGRQLVNPAEKDGAPRSRSFGHAERRHNIPKHHTASSIFADPLYPT